VSAQALARRYAKALLELAEEAKQLEPVGKQLASLAETWAANPALQEAFDSPSVTAAQRRAILEQLAQKLGLSPLVRHTTLLLSDRRRMRYLPEVAAAFTKLAEQKAGRIRAEVITAAPMPDAYFQELQKALESVTGKEVILLKKQDPSLIGGVVTRVGDKVFDGSLRARLSELREELLVD
jgi:F-type H+-transporting ATPase subunit delta